MRKYGVVHSVWSAQAIICFSVENTLHTIKGHPKPVPDVLKASVNLNPESIFALHKRVK